MEVDVHDVPSSGTGTLQVRNQFQFPFPFQLQRQRASQVVHVHVHDDVHDDVRVEPRIRWEAAEEEDGGLPSSAGHQKETNAKASSRVVTLANQILV